MLSLILLRNSEVYHREEPINLVSGLYCFATSCEPSIATLFQLSEDTESETGSWFGLYSPVRVRVVSQPRQSQNREW